MYKLKWDEETDEFFSKEILILFGIVLAKAIFEKIPINSYIDRTIIRQLCGGPVQLDDIYGFDEEVRSILCIVVSELEAFARKLEG